MTTGQRFELLFDPTPDAAYRITGRYQALLGKLTATNIYPAGGAPHAETLKAAIQAAAELSMDDTRGPYHERFMERIAASVAYDRQAFAPANLGYNGDRSDLSKNTFQPRDGVRVLYNGQLWEA